VLFENSKGTEIEGETNLTKRDKSNETILAI
jgi:hypothetical protein